MAGVYAGLDVSDKTTHVCVVEGLGAIVWTGVCASDPDAIARMLARRAPGLKVTMPPIHTRPIAPPKPVPHPSNALPNFNFFQYSKLRILACIRDAPPDIEGPQTTELAE